MIEGGGERKGVAESGAKWQEENKLLEWANSPAGMGMRRGRRVNTQADFMLVAMCKRHAEEAMDTIMALMRNPLEEGAVRLKAAQTILDRGFGKAVQQSVVSGVDSQGNVIDMNHTVTFVAAQPKCIGSGKG
jgi:hypothetical protein